MKRLPLLTLWFLVVSGCNAALAGPPTIPPSNTPVGNQITNQSSGYGNLGGVYRIGAFAPGIPAYLSGSFTNSVTASVSNCSANPPTSCTSTFGFLQLYDDPTNPTAALSLTPEQQFDLVSTARSAPSTTYYVKGDVGSDSNNCLSTSAYCGSCNHAITLGNATSAPYKVIVYQQSLNSLFSLTATGNTHTNNVVDGLSSTTGVAVGNNISGPSIPANATVASITSSTAITISANTTATASGVTLLISAGPNSLYTRSSGCTSTTGAVGATVDAALEAEAGGNGGRVVVTQVDATFYTTQDGTYSNNWDYTIGNVDSVEDRLQQDQFGNPVRMVPEPTCAAVASTPNSYGPVLPPSTTVIGGTACIHRQDGLQPTLANTLFERSEANFSLTSNVNLFIGSDDGSQWMCNGGNQGCVYINPNAAPGSNKHVVIVENVLAHASYRMISGDNFTGFIHCYQCSAFTNDDAYNMHSDYNTVTMVNAGSGYAAGNTWTGANGAVITVNTVSGGSIATFTVTSPYATSGGYFINGNVAQASTSGSGTGAVFNFSYPNTPLLLVTRSSCYFPGYIGHLSVQCMTIHETAAGLGAGNYYQGSQGGIIRSIGTLQQDSNSILNTDRGDVAYGGVVNPVLVSAQAPVTIYLDGDRLIAPCGSMAYFIGPPGTISTRNMANQTCLRTVGGSVAAW